MPSLDEHGPGPIDVLTSVINEGGSVLPPFLEAMTELGVRNAFADLEHSPYWPQVCAPTVQRSLKFLGHTAYKWRVEGDAEVSAMLARLDAVGGQARLLLSEDLQMSEITDLHARSFGSTSLKIRIYSGEPVFRLTIVDDERCGVSTYPDTDVKRGERDDYPVLEVWNALDSGRALFNAFDRSFEAMWSEAEEL